MITNVTTVLVGTGKTSMLNSAPAAQETNTPSEHAGKFVIEVIGSDTDISKFYCARIGIVIRVYVCCALRPFFFLFGASGTSWKIGSSTTFSFILKAPLLNLFFRLFSSVCLTFINVGHIRKNYLINIQQSGMICKGIFLYSGKYLDLYCILCMKDV